MALSGSTRVAPAEWRVVIGPGRDDASIDADGGRNMAIDQVVFDTARSDRVCTLRFYRWSPACLSLGRNQPARGRYDVDGRVPGRDIVRRPTGGLAVFHDDELTYSVTCPVGAIGSPRATYVAIHRAIARGLASLGVAAEIAPLNAHAPSPTDALGVCFALPAHGEILAAAGKLVGSAQRTEDRTILQHGSIIIDGSQDRAGAGPSTQGPASSRPIRDPGGATLKALLGRTPTDDELIDAIRDAFESAIGIRLAPASLSAAELDRLPEAERRYRSDDWTWRT